MVILKTILIIITTILLIANVSDDENDYIVRFIVNGLFILYLIYLLAS